MLNGSRSVTSGMRLMDAASVQTALPVAMLTSDSAATVTLTYPIEDSWIGERHPTNSLRSSGHGVSSPPRAASTQYGQRFDRTSQDSPRVCCETSARRAEEAGQLATGTGYIRDDLAQHGDSKC